MNPIGHRSLPDENAHSGASQHFFNHPKKTMSPQDLKDTITLIGGFAVAATSLPKVIEVLHAYLLYKHQAEENRATKEWTHKLLEQTLLAQKHTFEALQSSYETLIKQSQTLVETNRQIRSLRNVVIELLAPPQDPAPADDPATSNDPATSK